MENQQLDKSQIEKYLLNQLSADERLEFRGKMLFDKKLQKEVSQTKELLTALKHSQNPAAVAAAPSRLVQFSILFSIFLGGALAYYIWTNDAKAEQETNISSPQQYDINNNEGLDIDYSTPPATIETEEETSEENEVEKVYASNASSTDAPNEELIAQMSLNDFQSKYKTIQSLENLISGNSRGVNAIFTTDFKSNTIIDTKNGIAALRLNGNIVTKESINKEQFVLYLYDNNEEQYQNYQFLLKKQLEVNQAEDSNNFEVNQTLSLSLNEGLYYVLINIVDKESGLEEALYTTKFFIRK